MKTVPCRSLAWVAGVAILLAAGLSGCASTAPERHYRLVPAGAAATLPALPALPPPLPVVVVAPVTVPEFVDRPQIVTQGPGAQVFLSEQHRWAEPLKLAIGRLVAERLAVALGGALVWAYPAEVGAEAGYRVNLAVQRFDSEPGLVAHTSALWTVQRLADGRQRAGRSVLRTTPTDASLDALAVAHAQAVAGIADDIARDIAELARAAR